MRRPPRLRVNAHHGHAPAPHEAPEATPFMHNPYLERAWYPYWQAHPVEERKRALQEEHEALNAHHRVEPVLGHRNHRATTFVLVVAIALALTPGAFVAVVAEPITGLASGGARDALGAAGGVAKVDVCHVAGPHSGNATVNITVGGPAGKGHGGHGDPGCPDDGGNGTGGNGTGGNGTGGNGTGGNGTGGNGTGGNGTGGNGTGGNGTGGNGTGGSGTGGNQTGNGSDAPPVPDFTWSCTGLACSFDGGGSSDDGNITDYAWDFGDGGNGSGVAPVHTYPAAGDYNVTLTVTDDNGTSASLTVTVTVPTHRGGGGGSSVALAADAAPEGPAPDAHGPAAPDAPARESGRDIVTALVPVAADGDMFVVPAPNDFLPLADNRGVKRPAAHDAQEDFVGEAGHAHGHFDTQEFDFGEGHDFNSRASSVAHAHTHRADRPDQFPDNELPEETALLG